MALLGDSKAKARPDRPDTRKKSAILKEKRQEDHRAYLAEHCGIKQIIDSIKKIDDDAIQMEANELQGKKIALDARLKLLNKYLPDLKSVDIEGDIKHDGGLTITWKS